MSAEWIYEYKIRWSWLRIAWLKKKFRNNPAFPGQELLVIETKKNGLWKQKKYL